MDVPTAARLFIGSALLALGLAGLIFYLRPRRVDR